MDMEIFIVFSLILIALVTFVIYKLNKIHIENRQYKYIPAALFGIAIGLIYLKSVNFSEGYEGIFDMVLMIYFAVISIYSLLLAMIFDHINNKKGD